MSDLISRDDAIDAICKEWCYVTYGNCPHVDDGFVCDGCDDVKALSALPSADADRPHGEWILVKGSNGKDYHKCSKCFHTQEITGVKNYCAVCGADMRSEKAEE